MPLRAETAFILSSLDESTLSEFPKELDPCVNEALADPEVIDLILSDEELMDNEDFILGMLDTLGDEFPLAMLDVLADPGVLSSLDETDPETANEAVDLILDMVLGDDDDINDEVLMDALDILDEFAPDLLQAELTSITDPDVLIELDLPMELGIRKKVKKAVKKVKAKVKTASKKAKAAVKKVVKKVAKKVKKVVKKVVVKAKKVAAKVKKTVKKAAVRVKKVVKKVVKASKKTAKKIVRKITPTVRKTGPITGPRVQAMPTKVREKVAKHIQEVTVPAAEASSDPTPVPGIVMPKPETGLPQIPIPLPGIVIPELKIPGAYTIEFQELIPGIKPPAIPMLIPGFDKLPLLPGWTVRDADGVAVNEGMRIPTLPKGLPGIPIPDPLPEPELSLDEVLGTLEDEEDEEELGVLDTYYAEPDYAGADVLEATILEETDFDVETLLGPEELGDEALELDMMNDSESVLVPRGVLGDEELEL